MTIPLLEYQPKSQNERVSGYEVANEELPQDYTAELRSGTELDQPIEAAYRQIFFYAFKNDREPFLESQLRNGQITMRDFIRGLLLSETFRNSFYEKNNNYRFVEQCVERVLGRSVYNEREKIAWSIVIGTKGLAGFVDALLDSDEYLENFGYDKVPYQRRRVLQGRDEGERPTNIRLPRYDDYYRNQIGFPQIIWQNAVRRFRPQEQQPQAGDPSQYLNMARSLNAQNDRTPRVSAQGMDYLSKVPYRKVR
ncbi:MAG: phycobilisome rod-core linker polypeptide [Cyanophyceae cyanobacterium]